jgi:hypothetical protein
VTAGGLLLGALLVTAGARASTPATDDEAGGLHTRVDTPHGPIHLFRPAGYERRSAGLVIYVHGLYTRVDQAWREHHLAAQFAASGANALFIACEAPESAVEEPAWDDVDAMIDTALKKARLRRPGGALVAVGHSGAYRTLAAWLRAPALHQLILIDAMYGNEEDFRAWLQADRANRMTLVVKGTARRADPFVRSFPRALTLPRIPDSFDQLTRAERTARLLYLRSQYGHMELITEGRALPVLLRRTSLAQVAPSAPAAEPVAGAAPATVPAGDRDAAASIVPSDGASDSGRGPDGGS